MYFKYKTGEQTQKIPFSLGDSVLDALIKQRLILESPCGGNGTCGKCKVLVNGVEGLACDTKAHEALLVEAFNETLQSQLHIRPSKTLHELEETGFAIDIGTTGIEYQWMCLKTGLELARGGSYNAQIQYGADVFSRIAFAMTESDHLLTLQRTLVDQLNREMYEITGANGALSVKRIVIAANTTMCHLLLGLDPTKMAKYPYVPVALSFEEYDLAFDLFQDAKTLILPCASAFIGGDILSGVSTLPNTHEKCALFMDIGTNGEIAILKEREIYATSTAAGPAFEGMNISCGSRAVPGAISKWTLEEGVPKYQTIEQTPAQSICGSGLLHAVSDLLKNGLITKSGRFSKEVGAQFELAPHVCLTQKDIRQVQLAKGAILSGINALLNFHGLKAKELKTLYVAGNLGYHLSEETLKTVGLIPQDFSGNLEFLGNTSLQGAVKTLLKETEVQSLNRLSKSTKVLELSTLEHFQDEFVKALTFEPLRRHDHDL